MRVKFKGLTKKFPASTYNDKTYYAGMVNFQYGGESGIMRVSTMSEKIMQLLETEIELECDRQMSKTGNPYFFIKAKDNPEITEKKNEYKIQQVKYEDFKKFVFEIASLTNIVATQLLLEDVTIKTNIFDRLLSNGCVKVDIENFAKGKIIEENKNKIAETFAEKNTEDEDLPF